MKKFILITAIFFGSVLFSLANMPVYCDDCWAYGPNGAMVNWTFTGGTGDCATSYLSGNMYPWSTAYLYQDGVLVDVISYNNSTWVTCANYV